MKKRSTIKPEIMTITPDMAKLFLRKNSDNRQLMIRTIQVYADAMLRGEWLFSPDAICFDTEGVLMNGQHRLNAVIRADVPQEFLVVTGAPHESFKIMDIGRKRKLADVLHIKGLSYTTNTAAALVILYHWVNSNFKGVDNAGNRPSSTQILTLLDDYEEIVEYAKIFYSLQWKNQILIPATGTACLYILAQRDKDYALEFFNKLYSGANLNENSPILALRNQQMALRMNRVRQTKREQLVSIFKCWNAFVKVETMSKVSVGQYEDVPEILTPQPQLKLKMV